jgi:predicted PurR-regulated permease PerM
VDRQARAPPSQRENHHATDGSAGHSPDRFQATVLVASVNAIHMRPGLVILGVSLALPLTAFVYLASFIPIIGARVSGIVSVLVALVTGCLVKRSSCWQWVIAVQQYEAHVLQPVLSGRAVHVLPSAVALNEP